MMKKAAALLFGFCLVISVLVLSIELVVFNKGFYTEVYDSVSIEQQVDASREDIEKAVFMLVDYVHGDREDLDGIITWRGREQAVYNEKEISHMVDVKALWDHAYSLMWVCIILGAGCVLYLFFSCRKHWLAYIARGIVQAYCCFAVVLVFIGFWIWIDFSGFWVQFHHIFFSNDLWLLDPSTDFMIVICPEALFYQMIIRICLIFGIPSILFLIWGIYYLRKKAVIGFESI